MNRRHYLNLTATGTLGLLLLPTRSAAALAELGSLFDKHYGKRRIQPGRVKLELPALAENGNSVRLSVDAPLQAPEAQRLQFIELFASANPEPVVAKFIFGDFSASAKVQTRIRIAADQSVAAVAGYSDGSLWSATADIVVTEAACLDALY